jgi:hypothetical protein
MTDKIDSIQYSFDHQEETERWCRIDLEVIKSMSGSENADTFPHAQTTKAIFRARYRLALCEINEPPLPTSKELKLATKSFLPTPQIEVYRGDENEEPLIIGPGPNGDYT